MANSHESVGQHVLDEAADKLVRSKTGRLAPVAIAAIAIGKTDMARSATQQSVIGDCHPMRVAAEIIEQLARAGEGGFAIEDQRVELVREGKHVVKVGHRQ